MSSQASPKPYTDPPRLPEGEHVDLDAFLPGAGPLEIEIGPGRGAFLLERCAAMSELRFVGIEVRRKWATIVDERLHRRGLGGRARVVCEDARWAVPRLGPRRSVARVFLHFPDPWWKKRHQKRLVVTDRLLDALEPLLVDGGELFVQTDVEARARQYQELLDRRAALVPAGDQPGSAWLAANPYGARSNRERRTEADGLAVYRLRYRRAATGW